MMVVKQQSVVREASKCKYQSQNVSVTTEEIDPSASEREREMEKEKEMARGKRQPITINSLQVPNHDHICRFENVTNFSFYFELVFSQFTVTIWLTNSTVPQINYQVNE